MTRRAKFVAAGTLVIGLMGLGASDAIIEERSLTANLFSVDSFFGTHESDGAPHSSILLSSFQKQNFSLMDTNEPSLLGAVLADHLPIHTSILMLNDDRAAFAAWTESKDAELYFLALKDVLYDSFSKDVSNLLDESRMESQTKFHILTFVDPSLSEERFVFVRINELLIEFHIREGYEETIWNFIDSIL